MWRNRDRFLQGHADIVAFLTHKWYVENGYRLRKELFAFTDNKVSSLLLAQPLSRLNRAPFFVLSLSFGRPDFLILYSRLI